MRRRADPGLRPGVTGLPEFKLLYCSDPFDKRVPDSTFADEYAAVVSAGLSTAVLDSEEFDQGRLRTRPQLAAGDRALYRGWMMDPQRYARLEADVASRGAALLTTTADFRHCHHLPEWYSSCREFTPRTLVFPPDADFAKELAGVGWKKFFVKDYVKSLTTSRGSVAATPAEVAEIVAQIAKYRGDIEGGVCVREFEPLCAETEERYFSFGTSVHSRDDEAPPNEVIAIAQRVNRPFFSIDVVRRDDGALRLVEIGDGQVSDRKKWSAERIAQMFASQSNIR